jgi:hypothetical protein
VQDPGLVVHVKDYPTPPYAGAVMVSELIPGCHLVSVDAGGYLLIGHEKEIRNAIWKFMEKKACCAEIL